MRKLQGDRGAREEARAVPVPRRVPDVRSEEAPSSSAAGGAAQGLVATYATYLSGVRPKSPNKVVWSKGAALRASGERRRLREEAHVRTLAVVPPRERDFIHNHHLGVVITLVRVAPRPFDGDNLQASLKPVRDGVADAFNLRDDAINLTWAYAQRRGKVREYGVQVVLEVRLR